MKIIALVAAGLLGFSGAAYGQVVRAGAPTAPISSIVVTPLTGKMALVAGATAGAVPGGGPRTDNTEAQTFITLTKIKETLESQGFTMGDIVMLRVYLVADPNKGGAVDREGMTTAYKKFFGTTEQPNKPSRTTIQVAGMGNGGLVEIEIGRAHV